MKIPSAILFFLSFWLLSFGSAGDAFRCEELRPNPPDPVESGSGFPEKIGLAASKETQLDVIDVLLVFDGSARNWLLVEDKGTIEEYARKSVDKMNECLVNSAISEFKFRLVGVLAVNDDVGDSSLVYTLYNRLVDMDGHFVGVGEWKNVSEMRDKVGADIVSVLVAHGSTGVVGCGYNLDAEYRNSVSKIPDFAKFAYNVCSIQSADECCMLMHEVAHNMGCGHADGSCASAGSGIRLGPQLFNYSSGYHFWVDGVGYHTIMGYNFGGLLPDGSYDAHQRFVEVPCFSSPELSYLGHPCGTAYNDNRRTLRETYRYVAQFRASKNPEREDVETPDVKPEPPNMPYATAAAIYDGYLVDRSDNPVGMIQVKVAKSKLQRTTGTYASTVVATVRMSGERTKIVFKGGKATADGSVDTMQSKGRVLNLSLGAESLSGFVDDKRIVGSRNFFSSKSKADKSRSASVNSRFNGSRHNLFFEKGYAGVKISKNGKAKVVGEINGSNASLTAQLVFVDGEGFVPVIPSGAAQPSFVVRLSLDETKRVSVVGLGSEYEIGPPLALQDGALFDIGDGIPVLQEAVPTGGSLLGDYLPGATRSAGVRQKGAKWIVAENAKSGVIKFKRGSDSEIDVSRVGENPSGLKLKYKKSDGSFTGSFKAYYVSAAKKIKYHTVEVSGLLIGDRAFGFAMLKKTRKSWSVFIANEKGE